MEEENRRKSKKANLRIFLFIPIAAIALYLFVSLQYKNLPAPPDMEPSESVQGPVAPDFTLQDLDGRMVSLQDYRGKVVLLNIWATWCPPCIAEAPSLENLYKRLKDEDFVLLTVSIDEGGKEAVESFMKEKNLTFPVLLDQEKRVARIYRTTGVPESFIIRKDGTIDNKIEGAIDWNSPKIIEYFLKLMEKPDSV